jgi:uncharacterized membrane protein
MIDAASLGSVFLFWLAIGACGLLAWPLAAQLLPDDDDFGYLAAKPLGWLIGSYVAWLATYAGIAFWRYGWLIGMAGLVVLFALCLKRSPKVPPLPRLLQWEAGFLALLLVGAIIKGSAADIVGLEKFMDFGFVNAALRATSMPPPDPWWAGEPINYYYFGHVAAAWLIQLSGVPADHGFNLMIATLLAFAAALSYRIVRGCLDGRSSRVSLVCGIAAAALVTFGGNFHSVLYGPFRAFSPTSYSRDFFYPDSTRFVGFDPPTGDKGFTEMPAYGFAVGDLHAHLLNLPAAFLTLLIFARILQRETGERPTGGLRAIEIAMLGLTFAVSAMCNSWDAASYGLVMALTGLTLLVHASGREWRRLLFRLCAAAVMIIVGAFALASPFLLTFKPIASSLRWSDAHTPAWQLAALYAHVALPCLVLVGGLFLPVRDPRWKAGAVLAASAAVLIALPEIAYVKDIYGEDHRRANTMFKLTFEAQPIAMMASVILIGLLLGNRSRLSAAAALLLATPLLATLCYGENIYRDRLFPLDAKQFTLDGLGFIRSGRPDDMALIDWLRAQPPGRHMLMVEAPGDSFTQTSRLSALSGVPTFVGWRGHEWLWRGDVTGPYRRFGQVAAFYNARSQKDACAFVKANGVTHVAIGTIERENFKGLNEGIFKKLGPIVVQSGNAMLIEVNPAACGG